MPDSNKEESYWDSEYPKYIEVPKNYWISSHNIEYLYVNAKIVSK